MTPQGESISTAMVEYAIPVMWWVGPIKECQLNLDLSLVYLLNNKKYKKNIFIFQTKYLNNSAHLHPYLIKII